MDHHKILLDNGAGTIQNFRRQSVFRVLPLLLFIETRVWAIDPMVDQDLAYVSTITTKRKKETTKDGADLLDCFHKKTWPTSASTLLRVCFFSIKKKVVKKKPKKSPMPFIPLLLAQLQSLCASTIFLPFQVPQKALDAACRFPQLCVFSIITRRSAFVFRSTVVSIVSQLIMV